MYTTCSFVKSIHYIYNVLRALEEYILELALLGQRYTISKKAKDAVFKMPMHAIKDFLYTRECTKFHLNLGRKDSLNYGIEMR